MTPGRQKPPLRCSPQPAGRPPYQAHARLGEGGTSRVRFHILRGGDRFENFPLRSGTLRRRRNSRTRLPIVPILLELRL